MRSASVAIAIALVLSITILASNVPAGSALSYYTPLKPGDSAYYAVSSDSTFGYIPGQPVRMKVLGVSGTNVTASFVNFFPDGRILPNLWIDVSSGQRYNSSSTFFFAISPGLQLKDPIFNGWGNVTVVAQNTLGCGGFYRDAVGAQFFILTGSTNPTIRLAWDRATGALCGYNYADNQGRTLTLSMVNTTLWGSASTSGLDPFTVGAEISAFLGLPLLAVIMFVYFRGTRRKRRGSGIYSPPVR
ncbi:hypothetical protein E6H18_06805 [Candidatus Bathyarchaeota archaeon]|nr:MAG: hypothetical protein E6H18_06805 [Candidatus Bathyarchaeota archaeon]